MSLIAVCGFNAKSAIELTQITASLVWDTTTVNSPGGTSIRCDSSEGAAGSRFWRFRSPRQTDFGTTTQYGTFFFRLETSVNTNIVLCQFISSSASSFGVGITTDDKLFAQRGAAVGTILGTDTVALTKNVWHRVDFSNTRSSSGAWEVKLNGAVILSGTANFGGSGTYASIQGGVLSGSASSYKYWITDVFVDNAAYTEAEYIALLLPNGNGTHTAFTNDYTNVDEAAPYNAADYIETTTNNAETFVYPDMPSGVPIAVFAQSVAARVSGSGTCTWAMRCISNGTTSDGTTATLTTVIGLGHIYTTDPSGGGAWTEARINAMEVGVVLTGSGTRTVRCYWVNAQVAYRRVKLFPSGIATAEAFGTAKLIYDQKLQPGSIASLEAFGTATVKAQQRLIASAIASLEAFGTHVLSQTGGETTLVVSGIATAEAFGSAELLPGSVPIVVSGISSAEGFGSATVSPGVLPVIASAINSSEAFGTPTLQRLITLAASAVASAEAFGTAEIAAVISVLASAIGSAEAFGTALVIAGDLSLLPAAIASAEAFGAATIYSGDLPLMPASIASAEVFGTTVLAPGSLALVVSSIGSLEAFGTAAIAASIIVLPAAIGSTEAFGAALLLTGDVSLLPASIASSEVFGTAALDAGSLTLIASSIGSAEAFGVAIVRADVVKIFPNAMPSAEAFGAATAVVGSVTVAVSGVLSAESFGAAAVQRGAVLLFPASVTSAEAFGAALLLTGAVPLSVAGIASAEVFGSTAVVSSAPVLIPTAILSAEVFGLAALDVAALAVSIPGIASAEAFGSALVAAGAVQIEASGIASAESFGAAALHLEAVTLLISGIASAEAFGSALVDREAFGLVFRPISYQVRSLLTTPWSAFAVRPMSITPWSVVSAPQSTQAWSNFGSNALLSLPWSSFASAALKGVYAMAVENRLDQLVVGDDLFFSAEFPGIPDGTTIVEARMTFLEELADTVAFAQLTITNVLSSHGLITDTGAAGTARLYFKLPRTVSKLFRPRRDYFYDIQLLTNGNEIKTPEYGVIVFEYQRTLWEPA